MKTLYTASAQSIGGRNGRSETTDGTLKFDLATPGAINAKPGTTNPEQLFACGYAACFGSALQYVAGQMQLPVEQAKVSADVSLNQDENGFFLSVTLTVNLPGLSPADAERLVNTAHQVCPYSKATRGNIDVTLKIS